MGVEIWKLISYVPFGRDVKGVFACRVCGYTTTYIGRGKAPSYSCPKCGKNVGRKCEECDHYKPKGNGIYGCERWECDQDGNQDGI